MSKHRKILICLIILLFLPVLGVCAEDYITGNSNNGGLNQMYEEQLEASGAGKLWDSLPPETLDLLNRIGITSFEPSSFTGLKPENVANKLLELLIQSSRGPLRSTAVILGVVLLYAFMEGLRNTVKEESLSKVYGVICALAACATLIIPISVCIKNVSRAADSVSVLMISFVPVYAGVMLVSGQPVTAAAYQSVMLFAAELISLLATKIIVPLMIVSLALNVVGSVTPDMKLGSAGGLINKSCGWLLGLTTTIFVGLLSVQGLVGAAADNVTTKALKFSLGAFVPVVGGALGDALNTIKGCLNLLKSTLGGVGIISTLLIVLPPIIECVVWIILLSFLNMAAEMFSLNSVSTLFKSAQGVMKTLIAVLASCSMFMIVATTIVTLAGGGTS